MRSIMSLVVLAATSFTCPIWAQAETPEPPGCACVKLQDNYPQTVSGIGTISQGGSCIYVPDAGCVVVGSITLNYSPVGFTFTNGIFAEAPTAIPQPSVGVNIYNHTSNPLVCDTLGVRRSYLFINGFFSSGPASLAAIRQWSCH